MKYLLIFIIALSSFQTKAQVDQKAKSILDEVSLRTKEYSSITANFQLIMENSEVDLHEVNEGSLIVQGEAYKLNISGIEIFCDGTSQWTYMEDAGEVNISEANSDEEEMINPATIFTIYEKGFVNTYLGEFTSDSKKTFKIELVPDEINEFSRVILEIDQSNYQIMEASLFADGNVYTIKVNNMDTSKKYPASTFVFSTADFPDVDVIDMR